MKITYYFILIISTFNLTLDNAYNSFIIKFKSDIRILHLISGPNISINKYFSPAGIK